MSGAAVLAIVLFAFFAVGLTVGVVVVMALAARRADKAARRARPAVPPQVVWPHVPEPDPGDEFGEARSWQPRGGRR